MNNIFFQLQIYGRCSTVILIEKDGIISTWKINRETDEEEAPTTCLEEVIMDVNEYETMVRAEL